MSPHRRAARTDSSQREIVEALRKAGCEVLILGGTVDLAVLRYRSKFGENAVTLIECKSGAKAKWTDAQKKLIAAGWPLVRLDSAQAAIDWVRG